MKKIMLLLLLFTGRICSAQIDPKVGDKFIYEVDAGGQKYNFTLVLKSLAPDISFAWQMSNEDQSYGKLTIPAAAMANADKMYNYFSTGDVKLKNMTSVFLSRGVFKKLQTGSKTAILYDGEKKFSFTNAGVDDFNYQVNGNYVQSQAMYLSNDQNYQMTVLKNDKFPLILSMKIGWSIQISSYVPVKKETLDLSSYIGQKLFDDGCIPLWSKLDNTSTVNKEDLTGTGDAHPAVYKTYYAYAEGLMVETLNDTVKKILYYPAELYHQDRKYYGSHFGITQVKDFSLKQIQQRKAIAVKMKEVSNYGTDVYMLKNGVKMELYYHVPIKGEHGMEFNIGSEDKNPAKQQIGFISFE